jgi:hypothetical protein
VPHPSSASSDMSGNEQPQPATEPLDRLSNRTRINS